MLRSSSLLLFLPPDYGVMNVLCWAPVLNQQNKTDCPSHYGHVTNHSKTWWLQTRATFSLHVNLPSAQGLVTAAYREGKWSCSIMSDSLWPHGLQPAVVPPSPWDSSWSLHSPKQPPSMGFSRQEYWSRFPTLGSNLGLSHWRHAPVWATSALFGEGGGGLEAGAVSGLERRAWNHQGSSTI